MQAAAALVGQRSTSHIRRRQSSLYSVLLIYRGLRSLKLGCLSVFTGWSPVSKTASESPRSAWLFTFSGTEDEDGATEEWINGDNEAEEVVLEGLWRN